MDHYDLLRHVHAQLKPRTYVEVGVGAGSSLALATTADIRIGIDPAPVLHPMLELDDAVILEKTSDEAFAVGDVEGALGGRRVDLAFIDGMHLFEYALRDFTNLERLVHPGSVILVHDCLPIDGVTAARERTTEVWTGDIWKLVPCLLETRPDLHLVTSDVRLSGMAFVTRLDPESKVLDARREELERRWIDIGYDWLDGDARTRLRVSGDAWERTRDAIRGLRAH